MAERCQQTRDCKVTLCSTGASIMCIRGECTCTTSSGSSKTFIFLHKKFRYLTLLILNTLHVSRFSITYDEFNHLTPPSHLLKTVVLIILSWCS